MPDLFGRIPRAPYTVTPVPAALAPNYTAGRYNPGPLGAAGEYWVNTYSLQNRPLYALPALTLHEAAPGHHTQVALARELEDVPAFRRNFYPHAFGEGWGLYSEYLGVEMGIYHTPYERFGRLTYEMWRACRLVVDTGMHALGWSRGARARLPEVEHGALRARDPHRNRPLHCLARTGAGLQDRRARGSRRCAARRRGTRRQVRRARLPRRGAGAGRRHAAGAREAGRRVHRARAGLVSASGEYGRLLGPQGPLARIVEGFESRREQQQMADWVGEALETRGMLAIEAGTGTGRLTPTSSRRSSPGGRSSCRPARARSRTSSSTATCRRWRPRSAGPPASRC